MSTTAEHTDERTIERTLDIAAPAEDVWKALTDATELERWFALSADVEPGAGGAIRLAWGDYWAGRHDIKIWEPGRRLRIGWPVGSEVEEQPGATPADAPRDAAGRLVELTVDVYLEGEGGGTKVRLVHSGFGKGTEWDDWYDGIRRGWDYELECLRHYLENHRDRDRHVAWARRSLPRTGDNAFGAVFGPDGLLTTGSIAGLEPGAAYSLTAFDGTKVRGRVLVNEAGGQFAGTVEDLNNGCFRVESFAHGERQEISVFIATWDVPERRMRDLEARWNERLEQLYA